MKSSKQSKISKINRQIIHELIAREGFDVLFDEGDITKVIVDEDWHLEKLVKDYQIANKKLLEYIERGTRNV
jgi:3-methyladenine DNA glycosylase Tag